MLCLITKNKKNIGCYILAIEHLMSSVSSFEIVNLNLTEQDFGVNVM